MIFGPPITLLHSSPGMTRCLGIHSMKLTAKLPMEIAMGLEDDSFPFGAISAYFKRLAAIFSGECSFFDKTCPEGYS